MDVVGVVRTPGVQHGQPVAGVDGVDRGHRDHRQHLRSDLLGGATERGAHGVVVVDQVGLAVPIALGQFSDPLTHGPDSTKSPSNSIRGARSTDGYGKLDVMDALSHLVVKRDGDLTTITLDRPEKRNALALDVLLELDEVFEAVGASDARGVVLAANGPVFSAGHNFGDMLDAGYDDARRLLDVCARLMRTVQSIPQPVCAKVHALATAAGCQLVATCDLAVAAESAGFAIPGGKGGLFCHTPLVAVARNVGRKRALELAFTGDAIDAATAADWGLINRAVPDGELDAAVDDLMARGHEDRSLPRRSASGRSTPRSTSTRHAPRVRHPRDGGRRHHPRRPGGHHRLPREAQAHILMARFARWAGQGRPDHAW